MRAFKLIAIILALWISVLASDTFISTKMGNVEMQKVHEYEHWLVFNGKRIQKFEERYVDFKQHYEGSNKSIVILHIDTGTSLVKPEYAVIEIANGKLKISNRVVSYDYTFKVIKATSKKIIMDIGLSADGNARTATYQNGKITVVETQPKFNATLLVQDIEAKKRAIHAHLNSYFRDAHSLEGYDIQAADGNLVIYKKDNFNLKYVQATLYSDGTTNEVQIYFKDNKPFYAQESFTYSRDFAQSVGVPANQNDIKKYYFTHDKLVRYEDNSGYVATTNLAHHKTYINKIANAIIQRNTCDN